MDWLRSGLAVAQKHAQETAGRAQVLAVQASEKARELAGPAMERAKAIAAAAAVEAQAKIQELTRAQGGETSTSSPEELVKYGVTEALMEYVGSLTYSTFSDYPASALPSSMSPLGPAAHSGASEGGFRLSPWQERHATLAVTNLVQLQHLRFALIPKRMSEEHFWVIYFTLARKLLPAEAFTAQPLSPSPETSGQWGAAPAAGGATSSSGGTSAAAGGGNGAASGQAAPPATAWGTPKKPSLGGSTTQKGASPSSSGAAAGAAAAVAAVAVSPSFPPTPRSEGGVDDDAELVDALSASDGGGDDADLDDDPELAAYLQEALDVDDAGDGGSDGGEDLDEYLNQLDAELNEEDDGDDEDGKDESEDVHA